MSFFHDATASQGLILIRIKGFGAINPSGILVHWSDQAFG